MAGAAATAAAPGSIPLKMAERQREGGEDGSGAKRRCFLTSYQGQRTETGCLDESKLVLTFVDSVRPRLGVVR